MNGTVREMSDALIDQVLAAVNAHVAATLMKSNQSQH